MHTSRKEKINKARLCENYTNPIVKFKSNSEKEQYHDYIENKLDQSKENNEIEEDFLSTRVTIDLLKRIESFSLNKIPEITHSISELITEITEITEMTAKGNLKISRQQEITNFITIKEKIV